MLKLRIPGGLEIEEFCPCWFADPMAADGGL